MLVFVVELYLLDLPYKTIFITLFCACAIAYTIPIKWKNCEFTLELKGGDLMVIGSVISNMLGAGECGISEKHVVVNSC